MPRPALMLFVAGMIGLGILALIYGDFALVWQPVAPWVPGRTVLAYGAGILMLVAGTALLFKATQAAAARVFFGYLIAWALLKVPAVLAKPGTEEVWLGLGELTLLLSGGWVLFARLGGVQNGWAAAFTGHRGIRIAQLLFGISLIPIGLSHLVYTQVTADYVPAWLPFRTGWAYLTGAGQICCGLGVLFSVYARVAAWVETCMLTIFTALVWFPAIVAAPATRLPWTAFFISWVITSSAGLVADSFDGKSK